MTRITWHDFFIKVAETCSERSTCIRRRVGAVAVVNNRLVATGYNGAPSGLAHCEPRMCVRGVQSIPSGQRAEVCRGVHAEQNLIVQCALHGVSMKGAVVYCTNKPCAICLKMLINLEVEQVIYVDDYVDPMADSLIAESGLRCVQYWKGGAS